MTKKVLILEDEDYDKNALSIYRNLGEIIFGRDVGIKEGPSIRALVIRLKYHIDQNFLSEFPNLEFIVTPTTGLNHIDVIECKKRNINIISLKGEEDFLQSITATTELTWGLILNLQRNIYQAVSTVKLMGTWNRDEFKGKDLFEKTLGIIGFGRIGSQMKNIAESFGMKTQIYEKNEEKLLANKQANFVSLDQLLESSDIISLHIDFNEQNINFINETCFGKMKNSVLFVNTSRGEIVNETDLIQALKIKSISGAAIDVIDNEQESESIHSREIIKYNMENDNLIITPHLGGCTIDSMQKTEVFTAKKLSELW